MGDRLVNGDLDEDQQMEEALIQDNNQREAVHTALKIDFKALSQD